MVCGQKPIGILETSGLMSCLMSRDWFRGRAFADVFFNILIDLPPLSAWLQIIWTAPTIATGFNVRSSTLLVKFAPPAQLQIIWTAPMIAVRFDVRFSTSLLVNPAPPAQLQIIWTAPMIAMCFDSCLSITHSASVNWRCFMKYLGCHIILDFMFFNITSFSSA